MSEVDTYIERFPVEVQERLCQIRNTIFEIVPQVTEGISYGMPAYGLNGKWFVYFAGYKKHIGFYPKAEGMAAFKEKLTDYKTSKGAVQFPLNKPLPLDLIREIIRYSKCITTTNIAQIHD
jgi:uncharacterized protein YdhG (YjbR/CyaY superfamily)